MEEIIEMSKHELEKIKVLSQVIERKISQVLAAKKLGISDRQVRKLLQRIKEFGEKAIISKKRGKPSNRCSPSEVKKKALRLVKDHYPDFGPKLANEYLKREHNLHIATETLRQWMINTHLWVPKNRHDKKLHPPRERRPAFGELIQVDGSHHDWFEGRSQKCVLMVFIDDATSAITSMYFSESESLEAYYQTLKRHLTTYGIPLALYGDRCSVLTPRTPKDRTDSTQFQKALKELGCELILAYSPQAKGRVERANRTLQDRLVKELRLRGISTISEANAVLEDYRQRHNKLFSKKPSEQINAHRSLEGILLEQVLSIRETRTLKKDFTIQFKNTFYQISTQDKRVRLFKKGKVEIRQLLSGEKIALFGGKQVEMKPLSESQSCVMDEKQLQSWEPRNRYIPPVTHPYKQKYHIQKVRADFLRQMI